MNSSYITRPAHILLDWGNTLMCDLPDQQGPMCDWPEVRLMPGVSQALAKLNAAGFRLHLATNAKDSSKAEIEQALHRGNIANWIEHIFCYQELGYAKPSNKFFQSIIKRLNCDPAQLIMLGDDLDKDVLGAQGFGIKAAYYNHQKQACESLKNNVEIYCFEDWSDEDLLPGLLSLIDH